MSMWGDCFGVFDFEIIGVDVDISWIVLGCIVIFDCDGVVVLCWNWFVDLVIEIFEGVSVVYGIMIECVCVEGRDVW